jgi:hypothetical protein
MRVFFWAIFVFFILFSSCENRNKNISFNKEEVVNIPIIENIVSEQTVTYNDNLDEKIVTIDNKSERKINYGFFNTCDWVSNICYFYKSYAIQNGWIIANGFYINPGIHYMAYYPYRFNGFEVPYYGPGGFDIDYTNRYVWDIESELYTDEERIITYYNKIEDYSHTIHYYDIPQEELLDIFHETLITGLLEFIDDYNNRYDYFLEIDKNYADEMISNLDSEGLAIFRNLLYAKNNYKFNNMNWHNIFTKYLTDYNGFLNNEDSFSTFTEQEKELLEIIIEKER